MKAIAAAFFVLCLVAPLAARLAGIAPAQVENRALASRPALDVKATLAPGHFEKAWGTYLRDQLPFRDHAAAFKAHVAILAFGESPNPRVIVGKGGFLFLERELDRACDTPVAVSRMVDNAGAWADWFTRRGGRLLVILVPDKAMVYEDRLPAERAQRYACSRARNEALRAGLGTVPNLTYIDLYPEVARLAAASATPVYHLRDTHWLGALSIMLPRQIVQALQPGLWNEHDIVARDRLQVQDLSRMIGIREEAPDTYFIPRLPDHGVVADVDLAAAVPRKVIQSGARPLLEARIAIVTDSFFNMSLDALEMYTRDLVHIRPSRLDDPSAMRALQERPILVVQAVMRNAHVIFSTQLTRERLAQLEIAP